MAKCSICKGQADQNDGRPIKQVGAKTYHLSCYEMVIGIELHPRYPDCDFPGCKHPIGKRCAHGWLCAEHAVGCPD